MESVGSPKTAGSSSSLTAAPQESRRQHKSPQGANSKPKSTPIGIIRLESLESGSDVKVHIEHCVFLASYNWTKTKDPTVFIPGAPALWTAPTLPVTIPKDDGKVVAYCTCVFGLIKMKFRRLIVLISDDVMIFCPQRKKANLTEFF